MAYCPQCGREQKCGCEVCHHCGVPLVDEGHAAAEARPPVRSVADEISARVVQETEPPTEPSDEQEAARVVLPLLLLVLGCGILLIALIEIIHTTSDFVGPGGGTAPAVKHIGYYLGSLLYNSSVRLLIGFALTAAGFFFSPPLPFSKRENWRRAVMALGISMGVVAVFYLLAAVLIIIPGSLSLLVRNLLPSPATSISVFIVMGIALLAGSYLVTTRAGVSRARPLRSGREPG